MLKLTRFNNRENSRGFDKIFFMLGEIFNYIIFIGQMLSFLKIVRDQKFNLEEEFG